MKKLVLITLLSMCVGSIQAQSGNLFGIVRKNFYTLVPHPIFPGQTIERFDSVNIRFGSLNLNTGFVTNVGTATYRQNVNLTGAALNPYNNTYTYMGGASTLNTFDLTTGNMINQAPLSNPLGATLFDNFRFNQSDSTLYGLVRRYTPNPNGPGGTTELFLGKANTTTGELTQLSPASVGQQFALSGSAIDPYEMVYYYSDGSQLIGLDLYTGAVYSQVPFGLPADTRFNNFTYSCADTALYGLVRQDYFSTIPNPHAPGGVSRVLDSTTVKLGKINPNTGAVTVISPSNVSVDVRGPFSISAGSAIDPFTMTYYYSSSTHLIGVSMVTGLRTTYLPFTFAFGDFFDLMRNTENCFSALARRRITPTSIDREATAFVSVYPNPANDMLQVSSSEPIRYVEVTAVDGKILGSFPANEAARGINLSGLAPGVYLVKVVHHNEQVVFRKWIKA